MTCPTPPGWKVKYILAPGLRVGRVVDHGEAATVHVQHVSRRRQVVHDELDHRGVLHGDEGHALGAAPPLRVQQRRGRPSGKRKKGNGKRGTAHLTHLRVCFLRL